MQERDSLSYNNLFIHPRGRLQLPRVLLLACRTPPAKFLRGGGKGVKTDSWRPLFALDPCGIPPLLHPIRTVPKAPRLPGLEVQAATLGAKCCVLPSVVPGGGTVPATRLHLGRSCRRPRGGPLHHCFSSAISNSCLRRDYQQVGGEVARYVSFKQAAPGPARPHHRYAWPPLVG